jgi:hypothetical protein
LSPRERAGSIFQPLERFFADFPTIGKKLSRFSNDWKKVSNGWKIPAGFSNDWKTFFQWLENFSPQP